MENLRKRISVKIVSNEKDFLKHVSKPTCISHKIFNKNYAAIHEIKLDLTLSKPIYIGFTVLELSKWLMYDFHYSFMKKNWSRTVIYWYRSLTYKIKSEDLYEELLKQKYLFYLSNFPKDSEFFHPSNEKVIGKMKDIHEGKPR